MMGREACLGGACVPCKHQQLAWRKTQGAGFMVIAAFCFSLFSAVSEDIPPHVNKSAYENTNHDHSPTQKWFYVSTLAAF